MKERPILFIPLMVQAMLSGRKTQTRRVIKDDWINVTDPEFMPEFEFVRFWDQHAKFCEKNNWTHERYVKCRYGNPGDVLWVRESWNYAGDTGHYFYKAGFNHHLAGYENVPDVKDFKFRPSIHMPKEACRIRLDVADIRVERLQDISENDAISEGVLFLSDEWVYNHFPNYKKLHYEWKRRQQESDVIEKPPLGPRPSERFEALWKSLHGEDSWNANPWVWVISFPAFLANPSPVAPRSTHADDKIYLPES